MVEARENIDLVTIRRQSDLDTSQRTFERLQQETTATAEDPAGDSESDAEPVAIETVPPPSTEDPAVTLNRLRLGVVAVLALVLLLVLVIQRRHGRGG